MNRRYIIIIGIFTCLLVISAISEKKCYEKNKALTEANERLSSNIDAINAGVDTLRAKNNVLLIQTQEQTYTISELKKYNADIEKLLKEAKIKEKNVKEYQVVTTEVVLRDTIELIEYENHSVGTFSDSWITIDFLIVEDSMEFNMKMKDTVDVIVHLTKDKRSFKEWITFKKKTSTCYVLAKNKCPYAITTVKNVKLIKDN